jgi:phage/plasmid-associated DNA primase
VFADEVLWGGNQRAAGRLKTLVTERYLSIERKGVDMVSYTNLMRLIIASNEEWVIPAGPESRRWFVVEVSKDYRSNFDYFMKLKAFFDGSGLNHLMHFLINRKIRNNLREAMVTDALIIQRSMKSSQDDISMWISQILETGAYENWYHQGEFESIDVVGAKKSGHRMDKKELYSHYINWCQQSKTRVRVPVTFWTKMKIFGLDERTKIRDKETKERIRAIVLPSPEELEESYNQSIGNIKRKS